MADAAAARREARRRKILENSHNRLQFISGKNSDDNFKESPDRTPISDENNETTVFTDSNSSSRSSLNNGMLVNEPNSFEMLSTNQNIDAAGDREVVNDLAALLAPAPEATIQSPSIWEKLFTYKYDIVLLSLLIQLLNSISWITFDSTYFFLPIFMYIVTKLTWFPTQSMSHIAGVFLLCGIPASRVYKILRITQWTTAISQDICVYLFITICCQSLYKTLKETFVT